MSGGVVEWWVEEGGGSVYAVWATAYTVNTFISQCVTHTCEVKRDRGTLHTTECE